MSSEATNMDVQRTGGFAGDVLLISDGDSDHELHSIRSGETDASRSSRAAQLRKRTRRLRADRPVVSRQQRQGRARSVASSDTQPISSSLPSKTRSLSPSSSQRYASMLRDENNLTLPPRRRGARSLRLRPPSPGQRPGSTSFDAGRFDNASPTNSRVNGSTSVPTSPTRNLRRLSRRQYRQVGSSGPTSHENMNTGSVAASHRRDHELPPGHGSSSPSRGGSSDRFEAWSSTSPTQSSPEASSKSIFTDSNHLDTVHSSSPRPLATAASAQLDSRTRSRRSWQIAGEPIIQPDIFDTDATDYNILSFKGDATTSGSIHSSGIGPSVAADAHARAETLTLVDSADESLGQSPSSDRADEEPSFSFDHRHVDVGSGGSHNPGEFSHTHGNDFVEEVAGAERTVAKSGKQAQDSISFSSSDVLDQLVEAVPQQQVPQLEVRKAQAESTTQDPGLITFTETELPPRIRLEPASLDLDIGEEQSAFSVYNDGQQPVAVSLRRTGEHTFSVRPAAFFIQPSAARDVTVILSGTDALAAKQVGAEVDSHGAGHALLFVKAVHCDRGIALAQFRATLQSEEASAAKIVADGTEHGLQASVSVLPVFLGRDSDAELAATGDRTTQPLKRDSPSSKSIPQEVAAEGRLKRRRRRKQSRSGDSPAEAGAAKQTEDMTSLGPKLGPRSLTLRLLALLAIFLFSAAVAGLASFLVAPAGPSWSLSADLPSTPDQPSQTLAESSKAAPVPDANSKESADSLVSGIADASTFSHLGKIDHEIDAAPADNLPQFVEDANQQKHSPMIEAQSPASAPNTTVNYVSKPHGARPLANEVSISASSDAVTEVTPTHLQNDGEHGHVSSTSSKRSHGFLESHDRAVPRDSVEGPSDEGFLQGTPSAPIPKTKHDSQRESTESTDVAAAEDRLERKQPGKDTVVASTVLEKISEHVTSLEGEGENTPPPELSRYKLIRNADPANQDAQFLTDDEDGVADTSFDALSDPVVVEGTPSLGSRGPIGACASTNSPDSPHPMKPVITLLDEGALETWGPWRPPAPIVSAFIQQNVEVAVDDTTNTGVMLLIVNDALRKLSPLTPLAGAEIRSQKSVGHGCHCVSMRPAACSGVVTSFHLFSASDPLPGADSRNGPTLESPTRVEIGLQVFRGPAGGLLANQVLWKGESLVYNKVTQLNAQRDADPSSAPELFCISWHGDRIVWLHNHRQLGELILKDDSNFGHDVALRLGVNVWAVLDKDVSNVFGSVDEASLPVHTVVYDMTPV